MILFFGPPGAGKSVQGQLLAARHGWRWLSSGQLLRDKHDPELAAQLATGTLTDAETVNQVVGEALKRSRDIEHVIVDGYPRQLGQAKWLIDHQPEHERAIALVIILEVPKDELVRRLKLRGRTDDTESIIEERLHIYRTEIYPILTYLTEQKIHIAHIDGNDTVGQVHDKIEAEVEAVFGTKDDESDDADAS
ncbi:nucleoside monophosphate kinase [Candidatus Saccharibacteria bacterium]|nr:nucleoside monophosphate kinase [Candidatus Saccharibacteria bacterium]